MEHLSSLISASSLPLLTSIRIIGQRLKCDTKQHYLGHLLAFVSFKPSITSLEVETGKDLEDLSNALRTVCPLQPHYPNLNVTTLRFTSIHKGPLQGLLNSLSSVSHARLWLNPSCKEYTLKFEDESQQSRHTNIFSLKHMMFVFSTNASLHQFLDFASLKKGGLKTVTTSYATLHELSASRLWTLKIMKDKASCNRNKSTLWHAHIMCEGNECVQLCLEPTR